MPSECSLPPNRCILVVFFLLSHAGMFVHFRFNPDRPYSGVKKLVFGPDASLSLSFSFSRPLLNENRQLLKPTKSFAHLALYPTRRRKAKQAGKKGKKKKR